MDEIFDPRAADQAYVPFPAFGDWVSTKIDATRWDRYLSRLKSLPDTSDQTLRRARRIVQRVAAIETGAIEKLYDIDRGFTFTVAMETALLEAALSERDVEHRSLIESQLNAYDYVLDFATGNVPVAVTWIRELHKQICSGQKTYKAITSVGPQDQKLPLGKYKTLPNHVVKADGSVHSYAPVDLTPIEMQRLNRDIRSKAFEQAHPVHQASYAHYALVAVHPFADGNGRVARALASVFTYRSDSIPLLIHSEDREEYFEALERADRGEYQTFVDFTLDRCLGAVELVEQSLLAATVPDLESGLRKLAKLYVTRGGYTHAEVDRAGEGLVSAFVSELNLPLTEVKQHGGIADASVSLSNSRYSISLADYRLLVAGKGQLVTVSLTSSRPASARIDRVFQLEVPRDCGKKDDLLLRDRKTNQVFTARMNDLLPEPRASVRMRLRMLTERIVSEELHELVKAAVAVYRGDS